MGKEEQERIAAHRAYLDATDPEARESAAVRFRAAVDAEEAAGRAAFRESGKTAPLEFRGPGYIGREELACTGVLDGPLVFAPRTGWFRVSWVQTTSGRAFTYDIQARDYADAAWQVARYMFDSVHPDNRELESIVRLS